MITDSYDLSEAIITPEGLFGEKKNICDIAIVTFSREIFPLMLEKYHGEQIGEFRAANRIKPIYMIHVDGMDLAFYLSEIGSCMAGTDVIETHWKVGADKYILFGSAGSLDKDITSGKYVIPVDAYRDEGMSYHYAPPADFIKIRNAERVARIFDENGFPYVTGKVWTTDALYMETRELLRRRKEEGCIAVKWSLPVFRLCAITMALNYMTS